MGIVITLAILVGASLIAAAPRLRTASLAMILGGVFIVVSGAGLVSLGPSLDEGEGAAPAATSSPPGAAKSAPSTVEALATIKFNADRVHRARRASCEFNYTGATGHTLAIQDPKFDGFLLTTDAGGPKTGKVELDGRASTRSTARFPATRPRA